MDTFRPSSRNVCKESCAYALSDSIGDPIKRTCIVNSKKLQLTLLAAASVFAATASAIQAADSTLVADFEAQTNENVIDGFWYYVDDNGSGGNSKITSGDTTQHPVIFSSESFGKGA